MKYTFQAILRLGQVSEVWGAVGLIGFGAGLLGLLIYAWSVPYEWVVVTILPMLGIPYIIAVGALWAGIQGLFEIARIRITK